ncbi:hypothetical protein PY092_18885 [Muricauda sp. 334s03]|uniref:Uncharacterized protein n=1 Tax=Flagellimonas yonaguniensis TaxID=3031325 RepID=A0ABT5Y455_9FLAO|nr:hypothetical protein [[Muricauda] yonaguniensis]MDF0718235.1 hypothetical protein [[Muricauda] yonaguniensis]
MNSEINGDGNVASGRDTYITNNNIQNESKDYGVIQTIFNHVFERVNGENREDEKKSSSAKDKLIHIKDKIELNFKTAEDIEEVKSYFTQLYTKISFVENAFQSLDSEEQTDIHYYILSHYKGLKRSSENLSPIKILSELTQIFIPEQYSQNPTYRGIAQAIVLFFFDDCTIFEKTKKEPRTPTLFDKL